MKSLGVLMEDCNMKLHQSAISCVIKFFLVAMYGLICLWPPFFSLFHADLVACISTRFYFILKNIFGKLFFVTEGEF